MYMHYIDNREVSISVKLDDKDLVVDVWKKDKIIATKTKTYQAFGLEIKELKP